MPRKGLDSSGWKGIHSPSHPGSSPGPAEPFCKTVFLPDSVLLTCPGSMSFPGRSIYYGSPCGSGGYSHWGRRRTGEPGRGEKAATEGEGRTSVRNQPTRVKSAPGRDHPGEKYCLELRDSTCSIPLFRPPLLGSLDQM